MSPVERSWQINVLLIMRIGPHVLSVDGALTCVQSVLIQELRRRACARLARTRAPERFILHLAYETLTP